MWQTIASLRGRTTVVAISHHPALASVADCVYRIADGRAERVDVSPGGRRARGRGALSDAAVHRTRARGAPRLRRSARELARRVAPRAAPGGGRADARARAHRAARRASRRADLDLDRRARRARVGARARAVSRSAGAPQQGVARAQRRRRARRAGRRARARDHRRSRAPLGRARRPLPRGRRRDAGRRRGGRGRAVGVRGAERERRAHLDPAALRRVHGRQPVRVPERARAQNAAAFLRARGAPPQEAVADGRGARPHARDRVPRGHARPRRRVPADLEERRRARSAPSLLEEAAAAIDVDKAADLALAEKILAGESSG